MKKLIFLFFTSITILNFGQAQDRNLDTINTLSSALKEISGIVIGKSGALWALNDSGNDAVLFQLNGKGEIVRTVKISNAKNVDWEELAADDKGNIYIGDFGNNRNNRTDLRIYIVNELELLKSEFVDAQIITFVYEDQKDFPAKPEHSNFDMEAMVYNNQKLHLFSKNRTKPFNGYTNWYQLPAVPGNYVAQKIDSLKLGDGPRELFQITAADLSPDGKNVALLSYDKMYIVFDFPYNDFFGGRVKQIDFAEVSQKESLAWINDTTLFIADEKSVLGGGFLYGLNIAGECRENTDARKTEVKIPVKEFKDTLDIYINTEVRGKVYYEFYSSEGSRIDFGVVGEIDRGSTKLQLAPKPFLNGTYMLNIQVGKRPHAFFVYRFNPVDWEKVEAEMNKRRDDVQKQYKKDAKN